MNQTHVIAENTILQFVDKTQAELDRKAIGERAKTIVDLRARCLKGVDVNSPAFAICSLVSQTIAVGRDDGYPQVSVPKETADIVLAAVNAGILKSGEYVSIGEMNFYKDMSGIPEIASQADYEAWDAATTYRSKNKSK